MLKKKTPVTILTGHLGAGKTSLLRRMLRNKFGIRIAVIENEFGDEIGIERLFANTGINDDVGDGITVIQSKDLFIELSNGCVCCSVKDNLVNTLEQLLEKNANRFDHIVIETTGLADPGPLAGIFWLDDELECEMVLDGVLCVVDVSNILNRLDDNKSKEAEAQVAHADRIVLNKCDLLTNEIDFQRVLQRIKEINPIAPHARNSFDSMDLQFCFNIQAYDSARLLQQVDFAQRNAGAVTPAAVHDSSITSFVLRESTRPVDLAKLRNWIALLLWEPYVGEIFRIKGIVHSKEDPTRVYAVQGVHTIFEIDALPNKTWMDVDEQRAVTKIVVIGRNLNQERIQQEFKQI